MLEDYVITAFTISAPAFCISKLQAFEWLRRWCEGRFFIGKLSHCPLCLSGWLGLGVAVADLNFSHPTLLLKSWLGIWGMAMAVLVPQMLAFEMYKRLLGPDDKNAK